MDEKTFWNIVDSVGWPCDSDKAKRRLMLQYDQDTIRAFDETFREKHAKVGNRLDAWLQENGRGDYWIGGDGFSDLTAHVIGLGKDVFEQSLADIELVAQRIKNYDYKESFVYCIPHTGTAASFERWREMSRSRWPKDEKTFEEYKSKGWLRDEIGYSALHEDDALPETFAEMTAMLEADFQEAKLGDWRLVTPDWWADEAAKWVAMLTPFLDITERALPEAHTWVSTLIAFWKSVEAGNASPGSEGALQAWWWLHLHYVENDDIPESKKWRPLAKRPRYWGENVINDYRRYMEDVDAFKCEYHYKKLKEQL